MDRKTICFERALKCLDKCVKGYPGNKNKNWRNLCYVACLKDFWICEHARIADTKLEKYKKKVKKSSKAKKNSK